jgi:membrane-associated protease RseP (regulator of RpoE activity)
MLRNHWLAGVAVLALSVAPALAQESRVSSGDVNFVAVPGANVAVIGESMPASNYWIGVYCSAVPAELRSHLSLPEKQGVLVMSITKDSPAMKAGLAQYDILLRVGGKPLSDPRDLVTAIEAAKETKLKIELLRGGKPQTIEVTPAKRPAASGSTLTWGNQDDWNTIHDWMARVAPNQQGGSAWGNYQLRVFNPGAIVPKDVLVQKPLPKNMSIAIIKEGDQPAKITVKRDNDKWEVTEKELDKLPADVRPFVETMLGRGVFGIVDRALTAPNNRLQSATPPAIGTFNLPMPPPNMMYMRPFPGDLNAQIEKRFDEMNRRMDKLIKMIEEMNQPGHHPAGPEQQEKK